MEPKPGNHGLRTARQEAVRGNADIANVLAGWQIVPKAEFTVEPSRLLEKPALATEEEQVGAVAQALNRAVNHIYEAEEHRSQPLAGMKTFGVAILVETFGLTPEDIAQDTGALSDLVEYLSEMVYKERGIDVRKDVLGDAELAEPSVGLIMKIRHTWNLPDNEFGRPAMYERVDWRKVNPAEGN
ncbi:MAG TPA: hypothetical protein VFP35_04355 [Candidatus Saccharimonadales bacterium]|nr:hypothetical protein [Candidatus Saccharimonadales bacterium]